MNFFKSVFADSPPNSPPSSPPHPKSPAASASASASESESGSGGVGWSFGDMIQTLSSKSESVLETYRRDLQEFSTGLKAETLTLKHVAATSLDVGAAKAQVSLESVGLAIDSISSAVSDIIFHPDTDTDTETTHAPPPPRDVKYSRFESQLRGIQTDESTYTDDPVDELEKVEFGKWKLGFVFGDYEPEAEELLGRKDGGVEVFYERLVVNGGVDRVDFWLRYFYRVHRLKQAEFVRARLVNRAIVEDDEELSWDVDDDDNNNNNNNKDDDDGNVDGNTDDGKVSGEEEKVSVEEAEKREEDEIVEVEEKVEVEGKGEVSECSKDSDISIVSSQVSSHGEEDMGWDEIEDIGSEDDDNGDNHGKKGKGTSQLGSPGRDELRKRLSVAEDDEDLSWDIEDDDEPIKS